MKKRLLSIGLLIVLLLSVGCQSATAIDPPENKTPTAIVSEETPTETKEEAAAEGKEDFVDENKVEENAQGDVCSTTDEGST